MERASAHHAQRGLSAKHARTELGLKITKEKGWTWQEIADYEVTTVYRITWKKLIHEEWGDGIMSAIDFDMILERQPDQTATGQRSA